MAACPGKWAESLGMGMNTAWLDLYAGKTLSDRRQDAASTQGIEQKG